MRYEIIKVFIVSVEIVEAHGGVGVSTCEVAAVFVATAIKDERKFLKKAFFFSPSIANQLLGASNRRFMTVLNHFLKITAFTRFSVLLLRHYLQQVNQVI